MGHELSRAVAGSIAIPFAGVVSPLVAEGDRVDAGQVVASIEAMKMEAVITAPRAGVVGEMVITEPRRCEGGDILLVLESHPTP